YKKGIIRDLPNLPAFKGGVALGAILEEEFNLPVFINNDGNLFAYGEASFGFLPYINRKLEEAGSEKRFKNLIAATLGTGFGGGIVIDGNLLIGDNSNAAEIWLTRNKLYPNANAEENISVGALKGKYALHANIDLSECPDPGVIFEIALGKIEGNRNAALRAFAEMAIVLGDSLANLVNIIDGIVVLGGGISSAYPLFLETVINEMNSSLTNSDGNRYDRMPVKAYNLETPVGLNDFIEGKPKKVRFQGSEEHPIFDTTDSTGVAVSKLGTSKAIALGAYAIALNNLDKK
ncbi:MAG: ROK family protein, partial [Cyclobacteriaceae bacterium]|nr:ROK family protein [Cyclobacteriaceae bacterium]